MKTRSTVAAKFASIALSVVMIFSVIAINGPKTRAASTIDDFVKRCYSVTLGREPDTDGFNYWKAQLTEGKLTGSTVVYDFIFSPEYVSLNTTDDKFVDDLYTMFMGRQAETEGKEFWLTQLANGMTRQNVFMGFANSEEFYNVCVDCNIPAGYFTNEYHLDQVNNVNLFVSRLYRICLGRLGDQGGQEYWTKGLLAHNLEGIGCAANFFNSQEYRNKNLYLQDYLKNLYQAMMGREYDKAGFDYWLDLLYNNYSRDMVFTGFAYSPEFKGICESYGIVPGSYSPSRTYVDGFGAVSEYNSDNRLIKFTCPDDPDRGMIAYTETFEYDGSGRIAKQVCNGKYPEYSYVLTYSNYDQNGHPLRQEYVFGTGAKRILEFSYPADKEEVIKTTNYDKDGKCIDLAESHSKPGYFSQTTKSPDGKITDECTTEFYDDDNDIPKSSVTKNYVFGYSSVATFDSEGNPTHEEVDYDNGNKEISEYTSKGNYTVSFYNKKGVRYYRTTYVDGLLIQSIDFDEETGNLTGTSYYTNDSKGRVTRREDYDSNQELSSYSTVEYSSDGKLTTTKNYDGVGNLIETITVEQKENPRIEVTTFYKADGSLDYYEELYMNEGDGSMIKKVIHHADGKVETVYPEG